MQKGQITQLLVWFAKSVCVAYCEAVSDRSLSECLLPLVKTLTVRKQLCIIMATFVYFYLGSITTTLYRRGHSFVVVAYRTVARKSTMGSFTFVQGGLTFWNFTKILLIYTLKSTGVSVCFRGNSRLPSALVFLRWFKLAHISIQVCTFHDGCKQGIDQQIFNRKSISRKITHPQSSFK